MKVPTKVAMKGIHEEVCHSVSTQFEGDDKANHLFAVLCR